jgi:hypothetical protein
MNDLILTITQKYVYYSSRKERVGSLARERSKWVLTPPLRTNFQSTKITSELLEERNFLLVKELLYVLLVSNLSFYTKLQF